MTRIQFPKAREHLTLLSIQGLHSCTRRNEIFLFLVNTTRRFDDITSDVYSNILVSPSKGPGFVNSFLFIIHVINWLKLTPLAWNKFWQLIKSYHATFSSVDVESKREPMMMAETVIVSACEEWEKKEGEIELPSLDEWTEGGGNEWCSE